MDPKLYEALIGPTNTAYYLSYFKRALDRGYAPASWHWPAFFLGIFWFLYRKQYQWALIILACHLGISVVTLAVSGMGMPELANPIYLVFTIGFQALYIPLNANGIYFRWACEKVTQAQAAFPGQPPAQAQRLHAQGGVNRHLPLVVVLFMILLLSLGQPISTI